jgi:hypothetical protein
MLASKILKVNEKPNEYLDMINPKSMYILPTDESEIAHIVNTLKPEASLGENSVTQNRL